MVEDISGKKFNLLTVISRYDIVNRGWRYLCRCECGVEKVICGYHIKHGTTKSCGCLKMRNLYRKFGQEHMNYKGHGKITGTIWSRILATAKQRNINVSITIEDAWNLFVKQDGKCNLTNLDLYFAKSYKELKNRANTASLDRIDSSKGYHLDNIQWVHRDINYMKMSLTQERFIELSRLVGKKFPE